MLIRLSLLCYLVTLSFAQKYGECDFTKNYTGSCTITVPANSTASFEINVPEFSVIELDGSKFNYYEVNSSVCWPQLNNQTCPSVSNNYLLFENSSMSFTSIVDYDTNSTFAWIKRNVTANNVRESTISKDNTYAVCTLYFAEACRIYSNFTGPIALLIQNFRDGGHCLMYKKGEITPQPDMSFYGAKLGDIFITSSAVLIVCVSYEGNYRGTLIAVDNDSRPNYTQPLVDGWFENSGDDFENGTISVVQYNGDPVVLGPVQFQENAGFVDVYAGTYPLSENNFLFRYQPNVSVDFDQLLPGQVVTYVLYSNSTLGVNVNPFPNSSNSVLPPSRGFFATKSYPVSSLSPDNYHTLRLPHICQLNIIGGNIYPGTTLTVVGSMKSDSKSQNVLSLSDGISDGSVQGRYFDLSLISRSQSLRSGGVVRFEIVEISAGSMTKFTAVLMIITTLVFDF